jgi:hypothetical protein
VQNAALYRRIARGNETYVVPNRFKTHEQVLEENLPDEEARLLEEVRTRMGGPFKHAPLSFECWLIGRSPAMTITEGERGIIQAIAQEMNISLRNER